MKSLLKETPSIELLSEYFNYDKITGKLYWKKIPYHHFEEAQKVMENYLEGELYG